MIIFVHCYSVALLCCEVWSEVCKVKLSFCYTVAIRLVAGDGTISRIEKYIWYALSFNDIF